MAGSRCLVAVTCWLTLTCTVASIQGPQDEDHLLLPDVIPTGPALDQSAPVFLEVPSPAYVMRGKPATLTCRAVHALTLYFKCNDEDVADKEHSRAGYVDPQTAIRQLEVRLSVDMRAVDEYFGDYSCVCVAWSSRGEKQSPSVKVTAAFLEKQFHTPPYDERVAEDQTVELRCVPPLGDPEPTVSWLKNDVIIDVTQDPNYIISNEGNLLIAAARLSDMANYSCVAENVASRRVSPAALLTVFVAGGWSSWSSWSDCMPLCGTGQRLRHRSCDSPRPLNGGSPCLGADTQTEICHTRCTPVDGGWGAYGGWSACDVTCRQYRRRQCSDPAPAHGGRGCSGPDKVSRNCSRTDCLLPAAAGTSIISGSEGERPVAGGRVALYAGLAVLVLLLPALVLVVLRHCRRRRPTHSLHGHPEIDHEARFFDHKKKLEYAPDLTSSVAIVNHSPARPNGDCVYRDPNSNKTALLSSPSEHHYDEPHVYQVKHTPSVAGDSEPVVPSTGSRANYSSDARQLSNSSYCSSPGSGAASLYWAEPASCRQSLLSTTLPSGVNPDNLEFTTVSSAGATLSLPEAGVSLMIPEGAVAPGQTEEVYLAVLSDAKDRPQLSEQETLISPVVMAGPPGTQFLRPVVISFHHCANLKTSWNVSVYGSENQPDETPHWESIVMLGEETINTPVFTQLDQHRVHVMTESLQRLVLVGEPSSGGEAVKTLRLAAFGPRLVQGSSEYCIRVYVVEDTRAAFESVLQLERQLGGRLLDKPKTMLFESGGAGLSLSLEDLSLGWKCKQQAESQEIPFRHVWGSTCPLLHCSFGLQHVGHAAAREGLAFSARVLVSQKSSQLRRQMLRVSSTESASAGSVCSPVPGRAAPPSASASNTSGSSSAGSSAPTLDRNTHRLSPAVRQGLCQCLNPPNSRGNDWRMLAQLMQVNRYINYFATKQSPTDCILDLWEARHPDPSAATELLNMLRVMGRDDAARFLEVQLGT